MEVILLENILNLGNIGDKVKVKDGYGRNYLLKQGKALRFNKENQDLVDKQKDKLNKIYATGIKKKAPARNAARQRATPLANARRRLPTRTNAQRRIPTRNAASQRATPHVNAQQPACAVAGPR